jgi:hypothetical protein
MHLPRWFSPKRLSPAHQALLVLENFPGFKWQGSGCQCFLRGALRPTSTSKVYQVNIRYQPDKIPLVNVAAPEIDEEAPHLYGDSSLCLFHPGVFNWHGRRTLARCIVPWTTMWLYFYEKWQELGVWFGPEVPHTVPDATA